jgi:hypothetical protein
VLRVDPHPAHRNDGNAVTPQFQFLQPAVVAFLSSLGILVPHVIVAEFMRHDGSEFICIEQPQRFSGNQKDRASVQADEGHSAHRDRPKLHVVLALMERENRPDGCQLRRFRSRSVHEFGSFRLDSAERLLLRAGQPISLTPKAFDLLVYPGP